MTKEQIIDLIYTDPEYLAACKQITNYADCSEDLFQEVIMKLFTHPEQELIDIYDRGEIRFFFVGIISRMWHWKRGNFYQLYRFPGTIGTPDHLEQIADIVEEDDWHEFLQKAQDQVKAQLEERKQSNDKSEWFDIHLFEKYLQYGSYRKLEQETGIARSTASARINRYKQKLKR